MNSFDRGILTTNVAVSNYHWSNPYQTKFSWSYKSGKNNSDKNPANISKSDPEKKFGFGSVIQPGLFRTCPKDFYWPQSCL